MKLLSISAALTTLILTTTAWSADDIPELIISDSNNISEKLTFSDTTLIRSKQGFETRAAAQNFCKSNKATLADTTDILATIILNNDVEGNEIHANLNETASFLVVDTASGEKSSGFIAWLSDEELNQKDAKTKKSDIVIIEDGRGMEGFMYSFKEFKESATKMGAHLDKRSLVAFCKK